MNAYSNLIDQGEHEINRLREDIDRALPGRGRGPAETKAWQAACAAFHQRYDALAFIGGYATAGERIVAGETAAIEYALCFLECRPYFFRSGYMFKSLMRRLRKATFSANQRERYDAVLARWRAYVDAHRAAREHGRA